MANKLQVRICGQEYTLVSENSREYMLEIADYIDKEMIAVKNMNGRLSSSMAAILVALNIADSLKKQKEESQKIIENQAQEIAVLRKRCEDFGKRLEMSQRNGNYPQRPQNNNR